MLDISYEFRKGILFVRLCGELTKKTSYKLQKEITDMIRDNGITNVVFNISKLISIDEVGVNNLYNNLELCYKNCGKVLFCKPNKEIELFLEEYKFVTSSFIDDELCAFQKITI